MAEDQSQQPGDPGEVGSSEPNSAERRVTEVVDDFDRFDPNGPPPGITFTRTLYDRHGNLIHQEYRFHDEATGRRFDQDTVGFEGGDRNLYRYVGDLD